MGKAVTRRSDRRRRLIEEPPDGIYIKLVAGRGLTAYLLLRDLPVGATRWTG